ncbi:aldolase/citrate lyase family protein [Haladaptatus sp. NG-WS-4]
MGHPSVAELTAKLGFDFAMIDLEHTTTSLATVQDMVHAIEAVDGPTEPLVRIPDNDPVPVKRVLDTGVAGVMVPMIDSVAEAESLVDSRGCGR